MPNYRKFYIDSLNITEDISEYDIHHIDMNRGNNLLTNLLLLPKKLHHSYHFHFIDPATLQFPIYPKSIIDGGGSCINDYNIGKLQSFISVLCDVSKWLDYKYFLMGVIPNIHNLSIGGEK
jgi:hypothetical protein